MGRPDFTGTWLNTEIEGDVDTFFSEGMGIGWMQRKGMQLAKYGKGSLTHTIVQTETCLTATLNLPSVATFEMVFGETLEADDTKGGKTQTKYTWVTDESGAEVLKGECLDGKTFDLTRSMVGDKMCVELSFPRKGLSMKRLFTRQ